MKIWEDEKLVCFEKDNIQYMQFKKLLEYPEITHCYTLRSNGNLDFPPSYKNNEKLQESYKKICNALNLNPQNIVKPHQTHTDIVETIYKVPLEEEKIKQETLKNDIIQNDINYTENTDIEFEEVTNQSKTLDNVDGILTNQKELVLLTTSADCTSLLFYDPAKKVVGSVHSGWKGTLAGICKNAVNKMITEYESNPENIICCICPCIKSCCFEVDEDVKELFYQKYKNLSEISEIIKKGEIKEEKQKYFIDTTKINICLLKEMGLKEENIVESNICTVCHSDKFHSYRVDKENSGRNAAIIALN